ncbi:MULTISPECIES: copper resistance CopC/CopD family protein [Streptomyces]|uniref:Copper resistance protein CopC n=1 Tax=Streptomyces edwardsiae TaxID=3075527 RepID=A0ABU2QF92_9ACTN|nr:MULTISPECIES: copper resistance protein CopC [unclassified Streptomyces]MDT0403127.1 copper resistance protein CopC [Streptomyces sp. DSM 41635]
MLLGTLLVLLLGGAAPASAHAALRGADPEDGSVLKSAPTHITLTFTESVGLLEDSFRVYSPDNRRIHLGEPRHADDASDTARAKLPGGLADGTYTVAWRVISADSHPVSGAFSFSIGKPSPTPPAAPADHAEHPVTKSLYDTGRYLAYTAAALLIGAAAFAALCRPPDTAPLRAPLLIGWWTLLTATAALLVLRAPYERGTSPATAFDPDAFTGALTGRPGLALLTRVALLLTAALLVPLLRHRTPRTRLAAGAALSVALALTWAAAEHASAGIQVPLAMTSSVLHLLAMACWLGGLTALLLTLHRAQTPPPLATVARFSRLAFASVTVLVVTGVYQSWRGLGSWTALLETTYGKTLTVKLAATLFLLLAAAMSRRWTALLARPATASAEAGQRVPELVGAPGSPPATGPVSPAPDGPDGPDAREGLHRRALRRSVLAEVVVAVLVLLVTTVLTGTLPARAEAEAAKAPEPQVAGLPGAEAFTIPYDAGTPGGRGTVQLTMDPGRVGENGLQAVVFDPRGALSFVPELRISFTLGAKDIGPIDAKVTDRGGYWATSDLNLPLEGTWTMKMTIRVSEVDQVSETRQVRISR